VRARGGAPGRRPRGGRFLRAARALKRSHCPARAAQVNAALPADARSDDHDRALASALASPALCAALLPSVAALPRAAREALAAAAAAGFHLPQAGQGEAPLAQLAGLRNALVAEAALREGTALEAYLYHSIFDVAGAACSERFVLPLAIEPVFGGFARAKDQLIQARESRPESKARWC
jgi:hypothetical protein